MPTYIPLRCPNCPRTLRVRIEYLGRRVVCNGCKHSFVANTEAADVLSSGAVDAVDPRLFEAERALWGAERRELLARWERERRALAEIAGRLRAEQERAIEEQQNIQDRLAAEHRHRDQDRTSFRVELEALHCVVESLRIERNDLIVRSEKAEASLRSADERREDDRARVAQLGSDLQSALDREEALRSEIDSLRRGLDALDRERDIAFQEAGCLRLENEQIRLHYGELERSLKATPGAHGEHETPPAPHGVHREPAPAIDAPRRFTPDPNGSVEDQLRALRDYLREIHAAAPRDRADPRFLARFSRVSRPSRP